MLIQIYGNGKRRKRQVGKRHQAIGANPLCQKDREMIAEWLSLPDTRFIKSLTSGARPHNRVQKRKRKKKRERERLNDL